MDYYKVFLVFDVIMIQEIGSAVTSLCWPNLLLMAMADRGTTLSYYLDTSLGRQPGPDCWWWWGQRTGAMCRPSLITPRYPLPDLWTMFNKAWTLHIRGYSQMTSQHWTTNGNLKSWQKLTRRDQGSSEKMMNDEKSNNLRESIQKRP